MADWVSISEISEQLNIAENTARRYANLFKEFLIDKRFGRTTKYSVDAIKTIHRISSLYQKNFNTQEIHQILREEIPLTITVESENSTIILPPHDLMAQLNKALQQIAIATEQIASQEQFRQQQITINQTLDLKIKEQEAYIKNSLEKRDEQLMQSLREMMEKRKRKWWKFK